MTPDEMAEVRPRLLDFTAEMLGGLARKDQRAAGEPYVRFFTVRQSQPTSAAISAYDAPASCKARNLRMFIQFSGCRIIEEVTLRRSCPGSRHNEG